MCLQIRDEKSKESKLVSISLVTYVSSTGRDCMLAVAFVSVYITMFVHIHTQRGRHFWFFNVQKIFEQLIISEQCSTGEPEVSTESDGNAQKRSMGRF